MVWAAGLAICAMRTNNPFLLALIGVVACVVVSARRSSAPWSRSIAFFLRIGVLVIVIRVVIEILFGQRGVPGHVLFTSRTCPLPSWAAAVSIGGAVTLESILTRSSSGLQIAVILLCFGAANSLASPYRLLRSLPAVLYETGVAVTVALSFTPELVQSIGIVRQARRLRGIPTKAGEACAASRSRSLRAHSIGRSSATIMDARGYGRRIDVGRGRSGWRGEPPSSGSSWWRSGSTGSPIAGPSIRSGFPRPGGRRGAVWRRLGRPGSTHREVARSARPLA